MLEGELAVLAHRADASSSDDSDAKATANVAGTIRQRVAKYEKMSGAPLPTKYARVLAPTWRLGRGARNRRRAHQTMLRSSMLGAVNDGRRRRGEYVGSEEESD